MMKGAKVDKLPELRLVVKPYSGVYNKWRYEVQQKRRIKSHEYWSAILNESYSMLAGHARTEEKALEKGRKKGAEYCEYLLSVKQYQNRIDKGTIVEKITCQEEPV